MTREPMASEHRSGLGVGREERSEHGGEQEESREPMASEPRVARTSAAARLLIEPIRLYQRYISPVRPPTCRYTPSCSAYAVEVLAQHGAVRGGWLALWRLLRCHPWHAGGHDPAPPTVGRDGAGPGLMLSRPRQESPVA